LFTIGKPSVGLETTCSGYTLERFIELVRKIVDDIVDALISRQIKLL